MILPAQYLEWIRVPPGYTQSGAYNIIQHVKAVDVSHIDNASLGLLAARALWILRQDAATTAISAATNALVEGHDSQTLRELAGASVGINVFQLGDMIEEALAQLGIETAGLAKDEAQLIAAYYYAGQVMEGTLAVREFAAWAHKVIGHQGHPLAQDIVELDDADDAYESWGEQPDAMQALAVFLNASRPALQKWAKPNPT